MATPKRKRYSRRTSVKLPDGSVVVVLKGESLKDATARLIRQAKKDCIIASITAGATKIEAAAKASVDRTTLYDWEAKDPAFLAAMVTAEKAGIAEIMEVNKTQAKDPDRVADRLFFLKCRAGYREADKQLPSAAEDDKRPIQVSIVDGDGKPIRGPS